MNKSKNHVITIFITITLIMATLGAKYLLDIISYKKSVTQIAFSNVDVSKVYDGKYIGEYDVKFILAKVMVEVEDGKIKDIKVLEHKNENGSSAEKIVYEVISKNSTDVELISGATNSSKIILKAIENALE